MVVVIILFIDYNSVLCVGKYLEKHHASLIFMFYKRDTKNDTKNATPNEFCIICICILSTAVSNKQYYGDPSEVV